jgi:hypothetical protein
VVAQNSKQLLRLKEIIAGGECPDDAVIMMRGRKPYRPCYARCAHLDLEWPLRRLEITDAAASGSANKQPLLKQARLLSGRGGDTVGLEQGWGVAEQLPV